MKSFHLFGGIYYYPKGGYSDYLGVFVSTEGAKAEFARAKADSVHDPFYWGQICMLIKDKLICVEETADIDKGGGWTICAKNPA